MRLNFKKIYIKNKYIMSLTWYKPTEHGWNRYKSGKTGYYKGRGRATVSIKSRPLWKNWGSSKNNY